MGNNTPKDERLYKYQALYNAIYEIEKDILKDLNDKNYLGKVYHSYGLINKDTKSNKRFFSNSDNK